MITYVSGNLFTSPAKVLVNTVNTEGVMGKGIALEFKRIYPEMFREYRELCERGKLDIGSLHLFKTSRKWVLNFPTKKTWRQPSRVEYIRAGLERFRGMYADAGITSIAMPPIGCGNGQLDFESQVKPLLEEYLERLPISVYVYPARPQTGVAEHLDAKGIGEWLRSEPADLPFEEVWQDLRSALEERGDAEFRTPTKGTPFTVYPNETPPGLVIESASKTYPLDHEYLLEFWQQLRDFGFTYRSIAPEHHRVSYLIPIFELLPYVQRVRVSESTSGLKRTNAAVGLQVFPPPRRLEGGSTGDLFEPRLRAK